jgi:hypothetical protein
MRLKRKRSPETTRRPTSLKMRLKNYRLFQDSGWFTIAPLTCLVGRNSSSGKSSIISSILLLAHSFTQGFSPNFYPFPQTTTNRAKANSKKNKARHCIWRAFKYETQGRACYPRWRRVSRRMVAKLRPPRLKPCWMVPVTAMVVPCPGTPNLLL